jgi:hypothetical protein
VTNKELRDAIQQMSLEPSQESMNTLANAVIHLIGQVDELRARLGEFARLHGGALKGTSTTSRICYDVHSAYCSDPMCGIKEPHNHERVASQCCQPNARGEHESGCRRTL